MVRKLRRLINPNVGNDLPDGYINALALFAAIVGQARSDLNSRYYRRSAMEFLDTYNLPYCCKYSIVVYGGIFYLRESES